jgi:hypothetical protein
MTHLTPSMTVLLALTALPASGKESPQPEDPWFVLVPGRFVFVGRNPDNGATYAGTASITTQGERFSLMRTIGSKTTTATGTIEVPQPPGEGKVLRFRWKDQQPHLMTCLIQSDLDNYARLACLWGIEGANHNVPGLEAYFSAEAWPKDALKPSVEGRMISRKQD